MTRTSLAGMNCSWAQAAEVLADKWTLLIIRDAFLGVRTFAAFARSLGVAKNVLSQRLEHLQEHGVIRKRLIGVGSSRSEYVLTEKGVALFPLMAALGQWGDKWILGPGKEPWIVVERNTGDEIAEMRVETRDGRRLAPTDVTFIAGPGASKKTRALAAAIEAADSDDA